MRRLLLVLLPVLLAGCTDDVVIPSEDGRLPASGTVRVTVANAGESLREIVVEVAGPDGAQAGEGRGTVEPAREASFRFAAHVHGTFRVAVSAEDGGGGKAEGPGDPLACASRLVHLRFTLPPGDAEPRFLDASCA